MKATIDQLASVTVFTQLQPEQLEALQPHTRVQRYQAGEVVSHEGDCLPPRLYALIKGLLRVSKTATNGKETILRTLANGDIFAAPALFGNGIAPATVTAENEAEVLTVDRTALLAVIQANPEIALKMMAVFNQRLQQLHEMVHGLVSERAMIRLVRRVQSAAAEPGTAIHGQEVCLRLPLSYYEMARSIGITYEECVRLFKQLQSVMSYSRGGRITILDWSQLNAIASGMVEPDAIVSTQKARKSDDSRRKNASRSDSA